MSDVAAGAAGKEQRMPSARVLATAAFAVLLAAGAPARGDAQPEQLRNLIEAREGSIVVVRLVVKTQMTFFGESHEDESRAEIEGTIVDDAGLIMISGGPLTRDMGFMHAEEDFEVKVTPLEIKVVFDRRGDEHDAFLVATESKLGLAFIKVEDPGERALVPVSFEVAGKIEVGDQVASVSRLGKGFDYAPRFGLARVVGYVKKPRKAWIIDGLGGPGLPVFALTGEVLGVQTTLQVGMDSGDHELMGMESAIVPGRVVHRLVGLAQRRAVELAEERAKERAEREAEAAKEKEEQQEKAAQDGGAEDAGEGGDE